ncbi:head decoration protein [Streptomyces sp. DG2A-72]|uniref:head decoration protein n=1 Tax=Streptomyces sp. DG2A-72 TaxID=3051386 RepID=UPI00265BC4F7|nr:head decoration protein [Streptomyces sp. DG2A-72]MDO0939189.1 head decoration protein [Streptomyces sp. DG2A-72]
MVSPWRTRGHPRCATAARTGHDDDRPDRGPLPSDTITADTSKLTSGVHHTAGTLNQPRNIIKSGIPLGEITASGLYAPYNSAAGGGTQILAGFLVAETAFTPGSAKTAGALLWRGEVYAAKQPVAFAPPAAASTTAFINAPGRRRI